MNLPSNQIRVFPCANRGASYNLDSRLTTEYNLTNIINQLTDTKKFVITNFVDSDNKVLEFNINGYYFSVSDYTNIVNNIYLEGTPAEIDDCIYAEIFIDENSTNIVFNELSVNTTEDEEAGVFNGVTFDNTYNEEQNSLKLLVYTSDGWKIPLESKIRYNKHSISIDNGELD